MGSLNVKTFRKMVNGKVGYQIPAKDFMICCLQEASHINEDRIFPFEDLVKIQDEITFPCTFYEHYIVEYIHELGIAAVHYPSESCITCIVSVQLPD